MPHLDDPLGKSPLLYTSAWRGLLEIPPSYMGQLARPPLREIRAIKSYFPLCTAEEYFFSMHK